MKNIISLVLIITLLGCKRHTKEAYNSVETIAEEPSYVSNSTNCYAYKSNGSDIEMKINFNGNTVDGTLDYALAEKDKNTGSFTGKIISNIIVIDYTFDSEGTKSTRQLAFQLKNDKLMEGYGEMNEDRTKFKDITKLKFDEKMPLTKITCPK